jgi:hypothetical protein
MGTDTTARQNTIIWSATGSLILILICIIGWFATAKDKNVLDSIADVKTQIQKAAEEGSKRDVEIMNSLAKLCERVGENDTMLRIHDMLLRQSWEQRQEYFKNPPIYKHKN